MPGGRSEETVDQPNKSSASEGSPFRLSRRQMAKRGRNRDELKDVFHLPTDWGEDDYWDCPAIGSVPTTICHEKFPYLSLTILVTPPSN